MEESVTLKLGRYEALRDKARRVDVLEKENGKLKEELAIARKQLEDMQQPDENDNYVIVQDKDDLMKNILLCGKGIYSIKDDVNVRHVGTIKESSEVSELENNTNKVTLDATEVYQVIRQAFDKVKEEENVKSVKDLLAEDEMLHKMGVFKHYAKGGVTTKSELADQSPFPMLKRSKKNK